MPAVPPLSRPALLELPGVSERLPAVPLYPSPPSFPRAFDGSPASLRAYDEAIFQTARAVTRAKWQAIVWFEWLPALLGPTRFAALPAYNSSRAGAAGLDASSSNEFATAAFRFGHSQIGSSMRRVESSTGCPAESGPISLRDAYFTAARILAEGGVDPVIAGSLVGLAQEVDTRAVDEVRNLLFATNTQGFDLLAFNIQRGRDHGLPHYNAVRAAMGLPRAASFAEIAGVGASTAAGTSAAASAATAARREALAHALEEVYGDVDDVDLLVGGLAEPHVEGGSMGPLFAALTADVFLRIRDADRFWFESPDLPQAALLAQVATLDELRATRVADLLARTSEALDGRFGLEVAWSAPALPPKPAAANEAVAADAASRVADPLVARPRRQRERLTPALADSLFVARPDVLRVLDEPCGGAWAADIEALDVGLLTLAGEDGFAAAEPPAAEAARRGKGEGAELDYGAD